MWSICTSRFLFGITIVLEISSLPVRHDSEGGKAIPEQNSDLPEGDILDFDLHELIQPVYTGVSSGKLRVRRNAVAFNYFRWPGGIIPYSFDESYNKTEVDHILSAMEEFHTKTCIRFVSRKYQVDYLSIIKFRGCASRIGRQGGKQPLYLNKECIDPKRPGIVMHELMHSLGFLHEQTRYDRDDYIAVVWNNIAPSHQDNFAKVDERLVGSYDSPYDYSSVMHYGPNFFAVNYSNPTIIATKPTKVLGQRTRLSKEDAMKINNLYGCESPIEEKDGDMAESSSF